MFFAAIARNVSSRTYSPCSMESTPASTAMRAPSSE
jgi:hypothetical protein